jgi:hypothetical protein
MRHLSAVLCLALAGLPFAASHAAPGDLWEISTEMQGGGMSLPGMTQKVCTAKGAEGPEAMTGGDNRCQMTDIQRSPGRFSYKVSCPEGSGTGEMVYNGRESFQSTMTMTTDGQTMTMKTKGRRLGDCDTAAQERQMAAIQAQSAAALEQTCASAVEQMNPMMLDPKMGMNCDPKFRQQLCARLETRAGYDLVASRQGVQVPAGMTVGNLNEVAGFCGADTGAIQARLCTEASGAEDFGFIGRYCPAIAQEIAKRECAGRNFTTPPAEKYRDFCYTYAREMMQGEGKPGVPSPQDLLKKGSQRLKGILGR